MHLCLPLPFVLCPIITIIIHIIRRFKRSSRAAGLGTSVSVSAVGQPSAEEAAIKAAVAAAEKARYEQLKVEFQGWTLGFGLLGGIAAYYLYGSDVAASYALGSSAGLTYLRLLSRSVDAGEVVVVVNCC